MIIQRVFHTYSDDFPILSNGRLPFSCDVTALNSKMASLILELSDLTDISNYVYITSHTNDKTQEDILNPFTKRFKDFIDDIGKDQPFNIPTIWFVCHFDSFDKIQKVRDQLDLRNIKYFENGDVFESFEKMNETYWEHREDAYLFPKFLHQVTMIGIDLLKNPVSLNKLRELEYLEWLLYRNVEKQICDLTKMKQHLRDNSLYYQKNILTDSNEVLIFWENFNKVKKIDAGNGSFHLGSWPHFLFNICGASSTPRMCD